MEVATPAGHRQPVQGIGDVGVAVALVSEVQELAADFRGDPPDTASWSTSEAYRQRVAPGGLDESGMDAQGQVWGFEEGGLIRVPGTSVWI